MFSNMRFIVMSVTVLELLPPKGETILSHTHKKGSKSLPFRGSFQLTTSTPLLFIRSSSRVMEILVIDLFVSTFNPALTARFTFLMSQLGVDPSDTSIPHSAVIKKVAKWARNNNRNDQSDPLQFDIAVLIRR